MGWLPDCQSFSQSVIVFTNYTVIGDKWFNVKGVQKERALSPDLRKILKQAISEFMNHLMEIKTIWFQTSTTELSYEVTY